MRLADLVHPFIDRHDSIVSADPMGLGLPRYVGGGLRVEDWDPDADSAPGHETVVLATLRVRPQLESDLARIEVGLRNATPGSVLIVCLEDSFDTVPVPLLAAAFSRNGWRIQRVADLPYSRVRTGIVLTVADAVEQVENISLHNALLLADHELRIVQDRYEREVAKPPVTVTVNRVVAGPAEASASEVAQLNGEIPRLTGEITRLQARVSELRAQRDKNRQRRQQAERRLRQLRMSPTYRIGQAIAQAPRRPVGLVKLPVDLAKEYRARRLGAGAGPEAPAPAAVVPVAPVPSSTAGTTRPAASTQPAAVATIRAAASVATASAHGQQAAWIPPALAGTARLRMATIAGAAMVGRLQEVADVLPVGAGGWIVRTGRRLPVADLLLVDAAAGSAAGVWAGLGQPGEVERTRDLIDVLGEADRQGTPAVLLVGPGGPPPGLRALEDRFAVVLTRSLTRSDGWDPGIPLTRLPSPIDGGGRDGAVHVVDAATAGVLNSATEAWLGTLRGGGLRRLYVGARAASLDIGVNLPTDRVRTSGPESLAQYSVVAVPSADDDVVAVSALLAGCHVLAREYLPFVSGSAGVTVMEHPGRARALLDTGLPPLQADDVVEVARRLLDHGASQERAHRLAQLLDLTVAPSLRADDGLSLVASIEDAGTGGELARLVIGQRRPPRDIVVATDEPDDAAWLEELRSTEVPVTVLRRTDTRWADVGASARQHRLALWETSVGTSNTWIADLEIAFLSGRDAIGTAEVRRSLVARQALLGQTEPVSAGVTPRNGEY